MSSTRGLNHCLWSNAQKDAVDSITVLPSVPHPGYSETCWHELKLRQISKSLTSSWLLGQEILPLGASMVLLWRFYSSMCNNVCIQTDLQCPQGDNVRASVPECFPLLLSFYVSIWQMSGKWLGFFLNPFGLRVSGRRPGSCNEQAVPSVSRVKGAFRT